MDLASHLSRPFRKRATAALPPSIFTFPERSASPTWRPSEQCGQRGGVGREGHIGLLGAPAAELDPAVGDLDAEAVLAEPQLAAGVLPLTIERSSAERAAPHVPDPCEI